MPVSHAGTYRDSMPHSWPSAGLRHPTVPLAQCQKSKKPHWAAFNLLISLVFGAGEMNRTPDLLITNELLYRLSYTGTTHKTAFCRASYSSPKTSESEVSHLVTAQDCSTNVHLLSNNCPCFRPPHHFLAYRTSEVSSRLIF